MERLDATYRRTVGTEDSVAEYLSEAVCHIDSYVFEQVTVTMSQIDVNEPLEWRIFEVPSFGHLLVEHAPVVVLRYLAHYVRVGMFGLENDFTGFMFSAGTTGYLRQGLETAFVTAEIGLVEHGVGIEYSYNADIGEVESFGHHLCANQNIGLVG